MQQVIGKLAADQPGAEDQHVALALRGLAETAVVEQIVDGEDGLLRITGNRHVDGLRAPGNDQVTVGHGLAADPDATVGRVKARHLGVGANFGVELDGHRPGHRHAERVGILVHGEAGGEHRLGIGTAVVSGNQ